MHVTRITCSVCKASYASMWLILECASGCMFASIHGGCAILMLMHILVSSTVLVLYVNASIINESVSKWIRIILWSAIVYSVASISLRIQQAFLFHVISSVSILSIGWGVHTLHCRFTFYYANVLCLCKILISVTKSTLPLNVFSLDHSENKSGTAFLLPNP